METTTNERRAEATTAERQALAELYRLFRDAKGDHVALAEVRQRIAAEIDALVAVLRAAGVDTDALLDEVERLANEPNDAARPNGTQIHYGHEIPAGSIVQYRKVGTFRVISLIEHEGDHGRFLVEAVKAPKAYRKGGHLADEGGRVAMWLHPRDVVEWARAERPRCCALHSSRPWDEGPCEE